MRRIITFCVMAFCIAITPTETKAQNPQKGDYGYLYCHMSGRGEWTAYAISRDGLNYQDIINGDSIFSPYEHARIEGGTRDAYICRTHDCKGYLMVTTDMCVRKSKKWDNYGIDLLRSDDLINWKSVTFDFRKGSSIFCDPESPDVYKDWSKINRVWAPQIFWDPNYQWSDGKKAGISYITHYGTEMRRHTTECITHTPTRRSLTSQSHVSSLIGDMPLSMPTSIICLPTDSIT